MTGVDEQLRAYADAVARAQRPIALGEVAERRRRRPRRVLALVATTLAVATGVAIVATTRSDGSDTREVVVGPGTASTAPASAPAVDCPAASLTVTSTTAERLHPAWLPPGFRYSSGDEHDLGANDGPVYLGPSGGDRPWIELKRRLTTLPPDQLVSGTNRPVTVRGHPGVASVGIPLPSWENIAWTETPGTVLIVTGHLVPEADLLRVADGVEYAAGTPFTYPRDPSVAVTREEALAELGESTGDAHAALTSFGEFDAVAAGSGPMNHTPTRASDVAVTRPVWVVWSSVSDREPGRHAVVVDAMSAATIARVPDISPGALASLTDRSEPACVPPFGVLTRSEVEYLRPTAPGATRALTFTTQGALLATRTFFGMAQCALTTCDPTVPAWLIVESAPDHRYVDRISRPRGGTTPSSPPGSWSVTAVDARTGPQSSTVGSGTSLGAGEPPADLTRVRDLAPAG